MKNVIDLHALKAACLKVAKITIWTIKPFDAAKIDEHAEALYQAAVFELNFIDSHENDQNVVVRAIHYLADTQAIPPYWDSLEWFRSMLHVLVSLACPEVLRDINPVYKLSAESKLFMKELKTGIEKTRLIYLMKYVGGPSDGKTTELRLSREELFELLEKLKVADEPVDTDCYVLTSWAGNALYYDWRKAGK